MYRDARETEAGALPSAAFVEPLAAGLALTPDMCRCRRTVGLNATVVAK